MSKNNGQWTPGLDIVYWLSEIGMSRQTQLPSIIDDTHFPKWFPKASTPLDRAVKAVWLTSVTQKVEPEDAAEYVNNSLNLTEDDLVRLTQLMKRRVPKRNAPLLR